MKPSWAPPAVGFSFVWYLLYAIIAISYIYVGYLYFTKKISFKVVLPFLLNLIFNLLFVPIMFGLQNTLLASLDILLVLGTLIWALIRIYPHAQWVTLVNIVYLAWTGFATMLQFAILFKN